MTAPYISILRGIAAEIQTTIQQLEAEEKVLRMQVEAPEARHLYLAIWEDRFSLISESELPEGLSWEDYERVVLHHRQDEIHIHSSARTNALKQRLEEVAVELKAWQFAYSMVEGYTHPDGD